MYPVMLEVRDEPCLVVGGGGVALRKVDGLMAEGARVTVVASEPMAEFGALAEAGRIDLRRRSYRSPEASEYTLVMAATDEREVNRLVSSDARAAGVWVNVADDPELCTFHLPARVRRGALQLAIASAGEAPFVVRRLRQLFERRLGPEWAEWVEAAGRFRGAVRAGRFSRVEQEARYDRFFSQTVDTERLSARVPSEEEQSAFLDESPAGLEAAREESAERPATSGAPDAVGTVALVGAGPGDAGLLTLRGHRLLHAADVIVYDRLAATALPCDLPATLELHCVGKQASHHPVPQEEINAMLVRFARQGKRVVRLKGGDPFVFGRGSEEAEELAAAGIPFEVVPGVSAGIAAPAYAGIPVTHRREAVRVTFVTAHEARKAEGSQVRWDLLAADPHATLLGYMGVSSLAQVVHELLASGMDPSTPAALIQRGTTASQRVVRAAVAELPAAVEKARIEPPGLFVIGPTVRHGARLDWWGGRELCGQRLVLVAPGGALGDELGRRGAEIVEVPLPLTPAARVVMEALPLSGCVLRSAAQVDALEEERTGPAWRDQLTTWCLGRETAQRARSLGWCDVLELDEDRAAAGLVATVRRRGAGT